MMPSFSHLTLELIWLHWLQGFGFNGPRGSRGRAGLTAGAWDPKPSLAESRQSPETPVLTPLQQASRRPTAFSPPLL